jgi:N-acetylmuramoyl-L-alanine amidase
MKTKLSIFTLAIAGFISLTAFTHKITDHDKITIVLDAGHGGKDKGSQNNYSAEKDISLEIIQRVKKLNQNKDVEIILTREDDVDKSFNERTELINSIKPDYFISIHLNKSSNENTNGYEVYHNPKNIEAKKLATNFINSFDSPLKNRGIKEGNLNILRNSNAPGILYEIGFISNDSDYNYIVSEEGKQKIVNDILNFINQQ